MISTDQNSPALRTLFWISAVTRLHIVLLLLSVSEVRLLAEQYPTVPLSEQDAATYSLDTGFYERSTRVEGILIASSADVSEFAHAEAASQFAEVMRQLSPPIAERIRAAGVLCLLIGHAELTSDLPQFHSQLTGTELDFYNWRNRGFLTRTNGRPTVVFAEEDVLEYEGGMQLESILIHEFAHVIHQAGFDAGLQQRLTDCYERAQASGLWRDGRAAQRFRRVTGETRVSLLTALSEWFPQQPVELLQACLSGGDVLVNGTPAGPETSVTQTDEVLVVFGGEKPCYATRNRAEYWAEGVQCWFDTNRTMDHDHNHIHTREQLRAYDEPLARLCEDVLGTSDWRFKSPRLRSGQGHLAGFDAVQAPVVRTPQHIRNAGLDYYDDYWRPFWDRLQMKYPQAVSGHPVPLSPLWLRYPAGEGPGNRKHIVLISADQEYRSEQSLPMLAKILSRRLGYHCTVLFGVNADNLVDPTQKIRWEDKTVQHSIPGLEHLASADLVILFTRLVTLPDEQIRHIIEYLDSGKPVIGIRTANHGFLENFPYSIDGRRIHFGKDVLGGTFLSHHGNWHQDSTRGIIVDAQKEHPILRGVSDIWGPSDVYRTFPEDAQLPDNCLPLLLGQPLLGRTPADEPNPRKVPLPVAWTKEWTGNSGRSARVFHVTMGSARDFQSAGLRRLLINAAHWCLHQEAAIESSTDMSYVGDYQPLESGFNYEALGVEPRLPEYYE